ncbi:DUF3891 family protein [Pedobacter rhodius]|uniref:DUF3891 family protein n=1 Tax=Pedobacter rhodius TaxID=3004098 RepID=A0ABT4KWY1_9SPHI|nr:DUF3891 family protein [Pedobacter sp. SJ11]MCZ4223448.1 DUF3891 family protein [Pedobacter sp. SJ11]
MIVSYNEKGWEVVTQRGHGLLAGQICARWKVSDQPLRWVETLIATTEHDDLINEFESSPLLDDNGAPLNFKDSIFNEQATEALLNMALTRSRFIALLIARHISFTHGHEPKAKTFLKRLEKEEKKWISEAQLTTKEIEQAYRLLQFCDAFSLLICQKIVPPEQRKIEISKGPDGTSYTLCQYGEQLVVEPWPFELNEFVVVYETRTIKNLKFSNAQSFRKALLESAITLQEIKISSSF